MRSTPNSTASTSPRRSSRFPRSTGISRQRGPEVRALHDQSTPRPLTHRERGRLGALKRWGPHGIIVRLDRLDPDTRHLIEALLDQAPQNQAAKKAAAEDQTPATAAST